MESVYPLFVLLTLTVLLPYSQQTECICTSEIVRSVYECMDRRMFSTNLYSDTYDDSCILHAPEVVTSPDWVAGILFDQIVYMVKDSSVFMKPCSLSRGIVTYNTGCTPSIHSGQTLNPTPPTPPTTTMKPTTTTTATTTTASTTTTPPTTTTTKPANLVTARPGQTSSKCDFPKALTLLALTNPVAHPDARQCRNGGQSAEALLYSVCQANPITDFYQWTTDKKVIDECLGLLPGEPIGYYARSTPLGIFGIFVSCNGGTSFSFIRQSCGGQLELIDVATTTYRKEYFYTYSW